MAETVGTTRLVFGQPHSGTSFLFRGLVDEGGSTLPIDRFPHVKALQGDPDAYIDYLQHSWGHTSRTREQMQRRWEQFRDLMESVKQNGIKVPVKVVERPDGRLIVVDGNHRASIAHVLEIGLPVTKIDPKVWAAGLLRRVSRFGLVDGLAYQEVPGLLGGRRVLDARHQAIRPDDLEGRVLDLGCNLGAATRAAALTATQAVGVDVDGWLITAALRLGVWFDTAATFMRGDLEVEAFTGFDTVLAFAVDAHLKDHRFFAHTVQSANIVYVEANQTRDGRFPKALSLFSRAELVASEPRMLWRCEP